MRLCDYPSNAKHRPRQTTTADNLRYNRRALVKFGVLGMRCACRHVVRFDLGAFEAILYSMFVKVGRISNLMAQTRK